MTTTKHHDLGASTCERWGTCPGSVALSRTAPKLPPNKYAAQGTAAHEIAAFFLRSKYLDNCTPAIIEGHEIQADGFTFYLSDDDNENSVCSEHVIQYVSYVDQRIADLKITHRQHIQIEQRVNIPGTDLFGTADCILIQPFVMMEVIDFKYGKGVKVTAKDNKQLLYYATAAFLSQPENIRAEIPAIKVTIVQPRAPGGGIDSYDYTPDDIKAFMEWLGEAKANVELALSEYQRTDYEVGITQSDWERVFLKAGDHCRWCPANPVCPALKQHVVTIVGDAKADFANLTPAKLELPKPETLPIETLVNIYNNGNIVKDYIDKCYSLLTLKAKNGDFNLADFELKLVEGMKHRKWQNEDDVIRYLAQKSAKNGDTYMTEPKLRSPNQIEKLVEQELKDDIKAMAFKPQGEIQLAHVSDKRPAVKFSKAQDDFAEIALEQQLTISIEAAKMES